MKLFKILSLAAMFAFVTAFAACGKKDEDKKKTEAKPAAGENKGPEKPADTPAEKPADTPSDEATEGGGGDFDMEKGIEFTEKMADIIDTNKDNCKKMAEELSKFIDENKDFMDKAKGMQGNPEMAKEFAEKYKDRMEAAGAKMAGMGKCAADPAMQEAMKKMQ